MKKTKRSDARKRYGSKGKPGPVSLGRYVMCDAVFELVLDFTSMDSSGHFAWTDKAFLTVTVGAKTDSWSDLVTNLLHELLEAAFVMRRCNFDPNGALLNSAADQCIFVARHYQFTDIVRHVGDVVSVCLPDVAKVWNRYHGKEVGK